MYNVSGPRSPLFILHYPLTYPLSLQNHLIVTCMNKVRKFYEEYKPYIFSDGWYYVFIVVFILLMFIFFS